MPNFGRTASGVIVPKKEEYRCGKCGRGIVPGENEVENRVYLNGGDPICPVCRIRRGKDAAEIRGKDGNVPKYIKARKEAVQRAEQQRADEIAAESQKHAPRISDTANKDKKSFNT